MSTFQECLAHLAVGAWADNDVGLDVCRESLRSYLSSVEDNKDVQITALASLNEYFSEFKYESRVADIIKQEIYQQMLKIAYRDNDDLPYPSLLRSPTS